MQITRGTETSHGSADWFTGAVYVDAVAAPSDGSRIGAASVHFRPGGTHRLADAPAWPDDLGDGGRGAVPARGRPIEVIRPGDRVFFEPGENHWHGAAPTRLMTHIALQQADDAGNVVSWGDHVSDDDYGQAPGIHDGGTARP